MRNLVILICFVMVVIVSVFFAGEEAPLESSYSERIIKYHFRVNNRSLSLVEKADVSIFSPVERNEWQEVIELSVSEQFVKEVDDLGNAFLNVSLSNIPPLASKDIVVTAKLKLSSIPRKADIDYQIYTMSEKKLELDEPIVKAASEQFLNVEQSVKPKYIYDWVVNNFTYRGYIKESHGAKYALEHRAGDCTEYMYAYMALLRSHGIATKGHAGFYVNGTQALIEASDYHNWAHFYQDGRWQIADAQKQIFDSEYQNYIAFKLLGNKANPNRFVSSDKRLQIEMM